MRKTMVVAQCERRLVELGCPAAPTGRKLRELADHHEDLKQNALEEGLSEADAETCADQLLGEPVALAEYFAVALRQASWWGRHPILGFCVLPPLVTLALLSLGLWLDSLAGKLFFTPEQLSALGDAQGLKFYTLVLVGTYYAAILSTAILFCLLARRTAAGLRWAFVAAGICALHGLLFYVRVAPHQLNLGYSSHPGWVCPLVPLSVVFAFWLRQRWLESRLAPLQVSGKVWRSQRNAARCQLPAVNVSNGTFFTPTNIVVLLLLLALAGLLLWYRADILREKSRNSELRQRIWPAERAAENARVAARQTIPDSSRQVPIDLTPHLNAALTDSLSASALVADNHLAQLPKGTHIFGGVTFDVRGEIQLLGRGLLDSSKKYPVQVRNIPIARKCGQIYLLHGAGLVDYELGHTAVARLVLHYQDGSAASIPINSGEHLLDWWGPIYTTAAPPEHRITTAPGTELAWTGVNPRLMRLHPEDSLRVYKSAFANPHPELEITSLDYVSTLTKAAPFLLGLTVE